MLVSALALAACGGSPRDATTAGASDEVVEVVDPAWLEPLGLPRTEGRPLVEVRPMTGERGFPAVLIAERPESFVTFDGLAVVTWGKWAEDGPPPPRGVSMAEHVPLATGGVPELLRNTPDRDLGERDLLQAVFSVLVAERGDARTARELAESARYGGMPLEQSVRELSAGYLLRGAVHGYARGGSVLDLRRGLGRTRKIAGTAAAQAATELLAALVGPAPTRSRPGSALESLIAGRLEALHTRPCGRREPGDAAVQAAAALRALGMSAYPALEASRSDGRLSRCVGGPLLGTESDGLGGICEIEPGACALGPPEPTRLITMGALASRALALPRNERAPRDASDTECAHAGDEELASLMDRLAEQRDLRGARASAEAARGSVRAWLVGVLARGEGDAETTAFLAREAESGPVLLARIAAARALEPRGELQRLDQRVASIAPAVLLALRAEDDSAEEARRCDHDMVVHDGVALLVRTAPGTEALSSAFASLGPAGKLHVLVALSLHRANDPAVLAMQERLFRAALQDTRSVPLPAGLRMRSQLVAGCIDLSPSDLAGVHFAHTTRVRYSCHDPPADKARAVREIEERLTRGPQPR